MKKHETTELQTSAKTEDGAPKTDDELRYEAGHGGSYAVDPVTRKPTLLHATKDDTVSMKHPDAPKHTPADPAAAGQA